MCEIDRWVIEDSPGSFYRDTVMRGHIETIRATIRVNRQQHRNFKTFLEWERHRQIRCPAIEMIDLLETQIIEIAFPQIHRDLVVGLSVASENWLQQILTDVICIEARCAC